MITTPGSNAASGDGGTFYSITEMADRLGLTKQTTYERLHRAIRKCWRSSPVVRQLVEERLDIARRKPKRKSGAHGRPSQPSQKRKGVKKTMADGDKGSQGDKGSGGDKGGQGDKGSQGQKGPQGPAGPKG